MKNKPFFLLLPALFKALILTALLGASCAYSQAIRGDDYNWYNCLINPSRPDCQYEEYLENFLEENDGYTFGLDYCSRYPNNPSCLPKKPMAERRAEAESLPSAFDEFTPSGSENPSLNLKQTQLALFMVYLEELQKNPSIYWAFQYASRGPDAYKVFEDSESQGRFRRDALKMFSSLGVGILGVKVKFPDITQTETFQNYQSKKTFNQIKPDPSEVRKIAAKMTELHFICEGNPLTDCSNFHNLLKHPNIDSQTAGKTLDKAATYAKVVSPTFPAGITDFKAVPSLYPAHAAFVLLTDRNLENNAAKKEELLSAVKEAVQIDLENQRVAHIKRNDPIFNQEDPALLDLNNKEDIYKDLLDKTNTDFLYFVQENIYSEEMKNLYKDKIKYEQVLVQIKKTKDMHKFKKFTTAGMAWAGAVTAVTQTLGAPAEVVQFSKMAGESLKIFDAAGAMLIKGALDPTGITAIAAGVQALMQIAFNIPSREQIVQQKLDEILQNQQKILAELSKMSNQLSKIDKKLDHLSQRLNKIKDLIDINHNELLSRFDIIESQLENIKIDIKHGFQAVLENNTIREHEVIMAGARISANSLLSSSDAFLFCKFDSALCQTPEAFEALSNKSNNLPEEIFKAQQNIASNHEKFENRVKEGGDSLKALFDHSTALSLLNEIDFQTLSPPEIEKYLKTDVEERTPFLPSMITWLNETKNREIKLIENGLKLTNFLKENYETSNDHLRNNISFGNFIPPPPKNIAFPRLQDEVFFEYTQLASLLPPDTSYTPYINQICQKTADLEKTSKIMRQNIQTAWAVFQFYSREIYRQSYLLSHFLSDKFSRRIKNHLIQEGKSRCERKRNCSPNSRQYKKKKKLRPWMILWPSLQNSFPYGFSLEMELQPSPSITQKANFSRDSFLQELKRKYPSNKKNSPFLNGKISAKDIHRKFLNLEISSFFLNFNNTLNQELDSIFHDWEPHHAQSYGYIYQRKVKKQRCISYEKDPAPRAPYNCIESISFKQQETGGNINAFKAAQIESWQWYPRYVYQALIQGLNEQGLIANWMRARLALDTMARAGYGQELLSQHPELHFLNTLLKKLPARSEPIPVGAFKPKKPELQTQFSEKEAGQAAEFFKDIEKISKSSGNIIIDYAYSTDSLLETNSPGLFIDEKYLPECETNNDRILFTITNTKRMIDFLKSQNKKQINNQILQHYINRINKIENEGLLARCTEWSCNQAVQANQEINKLKNLRTLLQNILKKDEPRNIWDMVNSANILTSSSPENFPLTVDDFIQILENILASAVQNGQPLNFKKSIEKENFKFLTDFLAQNYEGWEKPLCSELTHKVKQWTKAITKNIITAGNDILSFSNAFYLPLPKENLWSGKRIGLGSPDLRSQALAIANLYDHLRPLNCPL